MRNLMKKATLAVALVASTLVAVAPAEAQWRGNNRYDRHRGDRTGTAVVAGIAGLAIGAAIASSNRRDSRYDYDTRYYDQRGYYPNDGYYARNYYNQRGYDRGGYNRGYYNGGGYGYDRCYTRNVYDPYIGRRVRVHYCD